MRRVCKNNNETAMCLHRNLLALLGASHLNTGVYSWNYISFSLPPFWQGGNYMPACMGGYVATDNKILNSSGWNIHLLKYLPC